MDFSRILFTQQIKTQPVKRAYVFCSQVIPNTIDRILKNVSNSFDISTLVFYPPIRVCFTAIKPEETHSHFYLHLFIYYTGCIKSGTKTCLKRA